MTHAVMAFGRMNPPTKGHEKLIKKVHNHAKKVGGSAHIIASHSEGSSDNPIPQKHKIGYIKKIAPHGVNVSGSSKSKPNLLHHASDLHKAGHEHLTVVAGSDRKREFHSLLHKYNGKKGTHGHYNFKSINVVSSGRRDPDSHGTSGVSGTSMRAHARSGDHASFKKGLPRALHRHQKEITNHINSVKEEVEVEEAKTRKKNIIKITGNLRGQGPWKDARVTRENVNEQHAKGGFDYEKHVNHTLQKHGLQKKGQASAGASADAPDGSIHANGKHHHLEIKKDHKAMMGQVGLHHHEGSWKVKPSAKKKYPATAKHIEKHLLPHVNKKIGKPSGDYHKDKKEHGNIYHTVKGTHAIKDHYGKDRKTSYMQIGGSGLHHTDKDHGKLGTKPLNGNTQYRMRVKYHGTNKKTGKVNYSHTVVLGLKDHKKSHVDLDHHSAHIGKKHAMNEAKSPLQKLKDFDKVRVAVGKKPIFKSNEKKKEGTMSNEKQISQEEIELQEVLTLIQRMKRSRTMRRFSKKIARRKSILSKRIAPKKNLAKRARRAAVRLARKKYAGKKGQQYNKLSIGDKMMVDKRIATKKAIIGKIAKRLMPKVRKAELTRLRSKGKRKVVPVRGSQAREQFEPLYHQLWEFVEQFDNIKVKDLEAIEEKAIKSGEDIITLMEVFDRGLEDWDETMDKSPEQHAFNRLNSFIANGKAREMDNDLMHTEELHMTSHEGSQHHVIKGTEHSDANVHKVRSAVAKAVAKHAGISVDAAHDSIEHDGHHHPIDASDRKDGTADHWNESGKMKKVVHKNMDAYVKHHAAADAKFAKDAVAEDKDAEAASKAATRKLNRSPVRQEYMRKRLASYKRIQRDQKAQTMPGFQGEESNLTEVSRETLGSYVSKASDARGHRGLPTKKVDNRYSGVAKASKRLDKMNLTHMDEPGSHGKPIEKTNHGKPKKGRLKNEDTSPALQKALDAVGKMNSPEEKKKRQDKLHKARRDDPGFQKWLKDKGRKNPYEEKELTIDQMFMAEELFLEFQGTADASFVADPVDPKKIDWSDKHALAAYKMGKKAQKTDTGCPFGKKNDAEGQLATCWNMGKRGDSYLPFVKQRTNEEITDVEEGDEYVQTKTGTHRRVEPHAWVANRNSRIRRAKVHIPGDPPKKPVDKAKVTGPSLRGLKPRNQRGRIGENVDKARMKVQHAQDKLAMAKDHKSDKTRLKRLKNV